MMKCGAREDQSVDMRDGHAEGYSFRGGTQHPAGRRAVDIEAVAYPHVQRRNYERSAIVHEPDVADEGSIDDRVDNITVEGAALGQTFETGSFGLLQLFHS